MGGQGQTRGRNREQVMSSENIPTQKIISPRFHTGVTSPSRIEEKKKSVPRVEAARNSMPVDKFSIFNQRKGQTNEEMVKSPTREVKQARKDDSAVR